MKSASRGMGRAGRRCKGKEEREKGVKDIPHLSGVQRAVSQRHPRGAASSELSGNKTPERLHWGKVASQEGTYSIQSIGTVPKSKSTVTRLAFAFIKEYKRHQKTIDSVHSPKIKYL